MPQDMLPKTYNMFEYGRGYHKSYVPGDQRGFNELPPPTLGVQTDTYERMFRSRLLNERARLSFHYKGFTETGDEAIVFLPFYENPKISENQSANYAEYNPVSRGGSLYAYTGARSRQFKVDITYTLPHLAMHDMGINRFVRSYLNDNKHSQKLLFTSLSKGTGRGGLGDTSMRPAPSLSLAVEKLYWKLRGEGQGGNVLSTAELKFGTKSGLKDLSSSIEDILKGVSGNDMNKILDTLLFFVSVLRTSVVNKSDDPLYGPPLIRLDFGTLYQSVPCICKSYNLDWEEDAGYHLTTLTPHRLKISLKLEEVRVGNFGTYDPATYVTRDNLTGWETAIASPHTTDPLPQNGFYKGSI